MLLHDLVRESTVEPRLIIRSPVGQKEFGRINGVAVSPRVFLQENIGRFKPGGQKKWQ